MRTSTFIDNNFPWMSPQIESEVRTKGRVLEGSYSEFAPLIQINKHAL